MSKKARIRNVSGKQENEGEKNTRPHKQNESTMQGMLRERHTGPEKTLGLLGYGQV